jgi:hypothetical protein
MQARLHKLRERAAWGAQSVGTAARRVRTCVATYAWREGSALLVAVNASLLWGAG